jgi:uncharacterized protein (TIGR00730 family)
MFIYIKIYFQHNLGGKYGIMGSVTAGARSKNGRVVGIIHENFCVDGEEASHTTEMIKCKGSDLTERKQMLYDNGDCIVILPGGVGTFDEFWECVSAKSLDMKGMGKKPICVVNIDGFYDGFQIQLQRAFDDGLLYNTVADFFYVAVSVQEALQWCEQGHKAALSVPINDLSTSRKSSKNSHMSYNPHSKGETIRPQTKVEETIEPVNIISDAKIKAGSNDSRASVDMGPASSNVICIAIGIALGFTVARLIRY